MPLSFALLLLIIPRSCQGIQVRSHENETWNQPHILFILLDDLGWSDVGFNVNGVSKNTLPTPSIDKLARAGAILKRHYVHKYCSPTRSAIQSGRAPIHVNLMNVELQSANPKDHESGFAGMPRSMTGMAELLKNGGYSTHMVGKWDVGMATPEHTPAGRGYDTSLIYFAHENGRWDYGVHTQCGRYKDLWEHGPHIHYPGRSATGKMNPSSCVYNSSAEPNERVGPECKYEDALFEERVRDIIETHNPDHSPLFLFWATAAVHGPYEPPGINNIEAKDWINHHTVNATRNFWSSRNTYLGMLHFIDGAIGRVVDTLVKQGYYDKTLIVFSSDNGAVAGMSNEPLKGAKHSNWEGGIRAASFVSGGYLPSKMQGKYVSGLVAAWDWYATFAGLAGVKVSDPRAEKAGLPPHDSVDVWPLISGNTEKSPRRHVEIGSTHGGYSKEAEFSGKPMVAGLIKYDTQGNLYKLILGDTKGHKGKMVLQCNLQFGPTTNIIHGPGVPDLVCENTSQVCSEDPESGCLYDLYGDESESKSIAAADPVLFKDMLKQLKKIQDSSLFAPDRGTWACEEFRGMKPSLFMGDNGRRERQMSDIHEAAEAADAADAAAEVAESTEGAEATEAAEAAEAEAEAKAEAAIQSIAR